MDYSWRLCNSARADTCKTFSLCVEVLKDNRHIELTGLDFNTLCQSVDRITKTHTHTKKRGHPLTWALGDKSGHLQQKNQLVPVVKMSLFFMCIKRWPQRRRLWSQVSMHNIGRAFQITKTKPEGGGPKLYQVCYNISSSNRARAEKSLWQQRNLRIQTNGGRSARIWFHLGARAAFSRPFIIYFHKVLAR